MLFTGHITTCVCITEIHTHTQWLKWNWLKINIFVVPSTYSSTHQKRSVQHFKEDREREREYGRVFKPPTQDILSFRYVSHCLLLFNLKAKRMVCVRCVDTLRWLIRTITISRTRAKIVGNICTCSREVCFGSFGREIFPIDALIFGITVPSTLKVSTNVDAFQWTLLPASSIAKWPSINSIEIHRVIAWQCV